MVQEQFIAEMSELQGVDFRGEGLPAGAVVYEQKLDNTPGANATWKKAPSKVRMGDQPLPERVPLYNVRTHDLSMVPPTIASKRMSEHPGVYTMRKPAGWDEQVAKPIDETCVVCAKERAKYGGGPKRFYDELDLEGHYESFHPREFRRIQREKDRLERREEQGTTNKLIEAISILFQQGRGGELPKEAVEAVSGKTCPDCGAAVGTDGFAMARHRKVCTAKKDGG